MKYILLSLRDFFRRQSHIFIIIIISVCVSAMIINLSYGLYVNTEIEKTEKNNELKKIASEINHDYAPTRLQVQQFVEALPQAISSNLTFYFSGDVLEYSKSEIFSELESRFVYRNGKYALPPEFRNNIENTLRNGRAISDTEESKAANVTMIYNIGEGWDPITVASGDGKSYITFLGNRYSVVGEFGGAPKLPVVPFLSIPEDFVYNKIVIIRLEHLISRSQYTTLKNTAEIYMPNAISFPDLPLPDSDDTLFSRNIVLLCVLISLLSVLNYTMLYNYILEKRGRSFAVYRICGCTNTKVRMYYLGECFIISIPSFILGTIIYIILLNNVLWKYFPFIQQADKIQIYVAIMDIYIIIMFLIMWIMIKYRTRSEILQELRRNA